MLEQTVWCWSRQHIEWLLIYRLWTTQRRKTSIGHQMQQLVYGTYGLQQLNLLLPQQELRVGYRNSCLCRRAIRRYELHSPWHCLTTLVDASSAFSANNSLSLDCFTCGHVNSNRHFWAHGGTVYRIHNQNINYTSIFFYFGATAPSGPRPPHSWSFCITLSYTPHSVRLLWTSDWFDADYSTWQHTSLTIDRPPCLRIPNKWAAADIRLRPRGHWDRSISIRKANL